MGLIPQRKRGPLKRAALPESANVQLKRLHRLAERAGVANSVLMARLQVGHTRFYFWLKGVELTIEEENRARELADTIERLLEAGECSISERLL